ncbi:hypothetical protein AB6A40_009390 [Gnathostoma spinigerum]|uniref:Uncharacterized protein n=1 Tax=Gnathostoma spinigerum TaxID=75299 RepID=A0ABD6ETP1_9BILA
MGSDSSSTSFSLDDEEVEPSVSITINSPARKTSFAVEDYERICTVGAGSFGRVYLVRHTDTQRCYALKQIPLRNIIAQRQIRHVHSERDIMMRLSHPYIVKMYRTSIDRCYLYMLFEYLPGGELFSHIRAKGHFSNGTTRFYAAEVVSALSYLHSKIIIYRDLKPENLLLTREGHVKLSDFGFAKVVSERTRTLCGTAEYIAPEIMANQSYDKAVDWWSLGILIYEMLNGFPPFRGNNVLEIFDKIVSGKIRYRRSFDPVAKDLVKKLLTVDPMFRLGNFEEEAQDIMDHEWFESIDWDDVYDGKITPPIKPRVSECDDPGNFDLYDEREDQHDEISLTELELFENW